jgi:signal transduction histidine kinase
MIGDVESYKDKTSPDIRLMDKDQLLYFLNGFSHKLKADITISYEDSTGVIQRLDSYNDLDDQKPFHGNFCKQYHEQCDEHKSLCLLCDESIARKYYQGIWKTPMIYNCHLGMWDMSFPLKVDNKLIGVIFAGQIIVDDDLSNLRDSLSLDFGNEFFIEACTANENQISNIINIIESRAVVGVGYLKELLSKDSKAYQDMLRENGEIFISYKDFASRYRDFKEFGAMLEALITKLHKLTILYAQTELLTAMSVQLSNVATCHDLWWEEVQDVVNDFRNAVDLEHFEIYYRHKSDYIQKIGNEGIISKENAKRIPLDMTIRIPMDQLVHISQISEGEDLLSEFDFDSRALVYRSEVTDFENQNISTLLLISSPIDKKEDVDLANRFCEMIAVRTNISGIFLKMTEQREEYGKRVRRVSHYTKTMLHSALSNVRQLSKNKQVNRIMREHLENIEDSIKHAKLEMAELDMKPSNSPKSKSDILPAIDDVVNLLSSWADERCCTIEYQKPTRPVHVYMNQSQIKIAITNLLENAIKYSYAKHSVRLSVSVPGDSRVIIKFVNFGIGIPEDMIKQIRGEGQRGEIRDLERTNLLRTGSGLGLPIAIEFIEIHNGSLHIRSKPADDDERNPFHRYVTTVTVTLPMYKERRLNNEH